jgi:hypothetical protein
MEKNTKKEYHELRRLPKMETEIALINAMVNVLTYESITNPNPNPVVISNANMILAAKVYELFKVINNPVRLTDTKEVVYNDEDLAV